MTPDLWNTIGWPQVNLVLYVLLVYTHSFANGKAIYYKFYLQTIAIMLILYSKYLPITVNSRYKKPPRGRLEVSYNERFLISRLIFLYKFLRDRRTVAYIEKFLITGVSYNESSLYVIKMYLINDYIKPLEINKNNRVTKK